MALKQLDTTNTGRRIDGLPLIAKLFTLSLIIPVIFFLGELRLSPYRLILIVLFLPLFFQWLTQSKTKIIKADWFILFFAAWACVSFIRNHGFSQSLQPSGIMFIETFGTYLLARLTIRNIGQFRAFARLLFWMVIVLAPFALYETLTGNNIALRLFGVIGNVFSDVYKEPRLGMDRVQGPFEHPILFGVFCGIVFGLTFFTVFNDRNVFGRYFGSFVVFFIAALALSSGPLTALTAQVLVVGWYVVFKRYKGRWKLLLWLTCIAFVLIEVLSNRSSPAVFISYFAFNESTAYNRILIWRYGSQSVLNNPLFGIGLNEWERAWFMSTSMDMFWLIHAVRHGIPATFFFFVGIICIIVPIIKNKSDDPKLPNCKLAYLTTFFGFFIAGWTVHYWNATYVLLIFYLGAGASLMQLKKVDKN